MEHAYLMKLTTVVRYLSSIHDGKDIKDNHGYTACDLAGQEGHAEVVKYLSGQELDVNQEPTWLISRLFTKQF